MKVVIIDKDELYLSRVSAAFSEFYADKLEIATYSDENKAQNELKDKTIDILIIGQNMEGKISEETIEFQTNLIIYFSDKKDTEEIADCKTICKYQQIDELFDTITGEYAQVNKFLASTGSEKAPSKIFTFMSAAGGSGATTVAQGFARHIADMKLNVLYISLEQLNSVGFYLNSNIEAGLAEAMGAVVGKKKNLSMKVSKCISTDNSGVNFLSPYKCILDMNEVTAENFNTLMNTICAMNFEYIIIDTDLTFDERIMGVFSKSSKIICITDATPVSNKKTTDAIDVIRLIDGKNGTSVADKLAVIYNKYSDTTSVLIEDKKITINGAIPNFSICKTPLDVSIKIAGMAMWNNVIKTAK